MVGIDLEHVVTPAPVTLPFLTNLIFTHVYVTGASDTVLSIPVDTKIIQYHWHHITCVT
jgi:hypothetical protein